MTHKRENQCPATSAANDYPPLPLDVLALPLLTPYERGMAQGYAGCAADRNPYDPRQQSEAHNGWLAGWERGEATARLLGMLAGGGDADPR